MRILVRLLLASLLASPGLEQPCFAAESANNIRIGKLVIESNSLPDADRERIIHLFQQKAYCQPEIGPRIEGALRNLGYIKAVVDEPKFSFPAQGKGRRVAYVIAKVEPGAQSRLGEIYIQKMTIFPSTQLRNLFPLRRGDLFNTTRFAEGMEDLRKLYATRGYTDVVAVPQVSIDASRHTVDLVVDVDEGRPYDFGKLYLEGVEPHAGAGKALMNSWKPLEGKRYNPVELQHWLRGNHVAWKVGTRISDSMRMLPDPESHVINVKLTQWPDC
ncbi:MAG TPA: POTRA domain-containing protein [Granulicella sp.]|jgi:hypothetical protein|nr:POTRA domain-containing protein [Granulicella sp.]